MKRPSVLFDAVLLTSVLPLEYEMWKLFKLFETRLPVTVLLLE